MSSTSEIFLKIKECFKGNLMKSSPHLENHQLQLAKQDHQGLSNHHLCKRYDSQESTFATEGIKCDETRAK